MCLMDGMKEEYISLQPTSIQITRIDMQGMIGIPRRNEELLHGNVFYFSQELILLSTSINLAH